MPIMAKSIRMPGSFGGARVNITQAIPSPGRDLWQNILAGRLSLSQRCFRAMPLLCASNCVHLSGWVCHGMPVLRMAFAIVTSLRAIATMTSLWGFPRILRACATGFRTGL